jgi:hypothetical protein
MSGNIARGARIVAGVTLAVLSIDAMRGQGFVRALGAAEIAGAVMFCLPRGWRMGGAVLLAILCSALVHHALTGRFAPSLPFTALVVVLELAYERP